MPSGFHVHRCPKCGEHFQCPQIAHCTKDYEALCPDHAIEQHNRRAMDELETLNQSFNRFFGVKH